MIENAFLNNFLKVSTLPTLLALFIFLVSIFVLKATKKKFSFSARMLLGLVFGLIIGVGIDLIFGSNQVYLDFGRSEISIWMGLFGGSFVKLIQLLAVPLVFLSIFFVVLDLKVDNVKKFTMKTFLLLLGTTAISALVGIAVVKIFNLTNSSLAGAISDNQGERLTEIAAQSFPQFFGELIPRNISQTFANNGAIVSVVIISVLFARASKFLLVKKPNQIEPFIGVLKSLKIVTNSVLINVIKLMPYAIVALVANTIISNGIEAIKGVIGFILALYLGVLIMLVVYVIILLLAGINPITFYKKAYPTMIFAFSSRSSVGTLPYTIDTLENKMGVSNQSANFIGTLATTIGMNGCAGVFPAMLAVIVGASAGVALDFSFYLLVVLVVTVGSIGIAGVPGTATVAATVTLNGIGLGSYFDRIGAVFGIDPIIDMGRTMLNVTGSMVSAVVVDKWEGNMDMDKFNSK